MISLHFAFRSLCFGVALLVSISVCASVLQAGAPDIKICNNSSGKIFYSIAGFDSEASGFQWRSIGWWNLESGECTEMTLTRLLDRHIFVHGEGDDGYWRGEYLFCVHGDEAFDVTGAYNCEDHGYGYEQRRFFHRSSDTGSFYVGFSD